MFLLWFNFLSPDPRLSQDKTSIYKYEGETLNTVQGSTSESTGLKLKALVVIHPLGACRYRMQVNSISNCLLEEPLSHGYIKLTAYFRESCFGLGIKCHISLVFQPIDFLIFWYRKTTELHSHIRATCEIILFLSYEHPIFIKCCMLEFVRICLFRFLFNYF